MFEPISQHISVFFSRVSQYVPCSKRLAFVHLLVNLIRYKALCRFGTYIPNFKNIDIHQPPKILKLNDPRD